MPAKTISVENMFECPFQYTNIIELSDYTSDTEQLCTLRHGKDCVLKECPLEDAGKIQVIWNKGG